MTDFCPPFYPCATPPRLSPGTASVQIVSYQLPLCEPEAYVVARIRRAIAATERERPARRPVVPTPAEIGDGVRACPYAVGRGG